MRRIMSLDELCLFCEQSSTSEFEAAGDTVIAVSIPASFSYKRDIDATELIPVTIKACHDNINTNKSSIPLEAMEDAKESFKNRPILAEIVETEDGEFDFGSHARYKEKDDTFTF